MPLVAGACLSYAIGLLAARLLPAAALALGALLLATGAIILLVGLRDVRRDAGLFALLAAAGVMIGTSAVRGEERCQRALAAAVELRGTLEDDARPGGMSHARLGAGGCGSRALIIVAEGAASGGEGVVVRGDVSPGAQGLLVRGASLQRVSSGPALPAIRARAGRRIDRIFGPDAPMVRALVIADMGAIPAEQRDRFARAGLVHMLSVSGLHVAIVALALELLAVALRLPRLPARIGTVVILGAYVLLIGAPPPAVRAAVMLTLVMASRMLQRPTSRWAVVAVGSAVPLVDPAVVVDLGWQLSVAGTVALVSGGALARRLVPRGWPHVARNLATGAVISIVATLATAPLVAWTFGRLALLGPLTNLLADPVMGILQPVLFLAISLPFGPVERLLADAAHLLLLAFDAIAAYAASVPHAAPLVLPSAAAALAGAVSAVALLVACVAREPARACVVMLAGLAVMTVEPFVHLTRDRTELHMLDVGQGDAIALRTRAGHWIVIDAGRAWAGGDAGRSVVVPYIAHRGGDVALFMMSHPHADHVGGAASLLDALHPGLFLDPGYAGGSPPYLAALAAARRDGVPWQRVHPGDSVVVDEAVITTLAPDSAWAAHLADANLASAVAMVRIGQVRILLTGDAEEPEEQWLLEHSASALGADVLKVAHHGSATSTTPAFLAAVRPRVALVSVGAHNSYGHPSADVMAELRGQGAAVLRTDQLGTVVVRTDGHALEVEARGMRWPVPDRAPR